MTRDELAGLLEQLITSCEKEAIGFKEGGAGFSVGNIGKYYSGLIRSVGPRAKSRWELV